MYQDSRVQIIKLPSFLGDEQTIEYGEKSEQPNQEWKAANSWSEITAISET